MQATVTHARSAPEIFDIDRVAYCSSGGKSVSDGSGGPRGARNPASCYDRSADAE